MDRYIPCLWDNSTESFVSDLLPLKKNLVWVKSVKLRDYAISRSNHNINVPCTSGGDLVKESRQTVSRNANKILDIKQRLIIPPLFSLSPHQKKNDLIHMKLISCKYGFKG